MKSKCHISIQRHHFETKKNLYVCKDCNFSIGKKWFDDFIHENLVIGVGLTKPISQRVYENLPTKSPKL